MTDERATTSFAKKITAKEFMKAVKSIDENNIKSYIYNEILKMDLPFWKMTRFEDIISLDVEIIKANLRAKGYKIYNSSDILGKENNLKSKINDLEKANRLLRHNVSKLQKKINKCGENKWTMTIGLV